MKNKEPLVVGQEVWIEIENRLVGAMHDKEVRLVKHTVTRVNGTSAYIETGIGERKNVIKYKIAQRSYAVSTPTSSFSSRQTLWLSEEAYYDNLEYEAYMDELWDEARSQLGRMSKKELEAFVGRNEEVK